MSNNNFLLLDIYLTICFIDNLKVKYVANCNLIIMCRNYYHAIYLIKIRNSGTGYGRYAIYLHVSLKPRD